MKPLAFVKAIRQNVIEEDLSYYRSTLEKAIPGKASPQWKAAAAAFNSLTNEQKKDFIIFIREIQVNTVSHLFGILDGSSFLAEGADELLLSTETSEEPINGELQDLFLEMEEQ